MTREVCWRSRCWRLSPACWPGLSERSSASLSSQADRFRNALIEWAHGQEAVGFLLVLAVCAGATAIAAWLVRRYSPHAAGSGIPHVEAVLRGELPPIPFRLIPVKFFGGLLAIGAGLALGREGPTVQMGASLAHLVGKIFGRSWPDCRVLIAAGAGAGLGTAFNAPIAGAVFVLEELVAAIRAPYRHRRARRIRHRHRSGAPAHSATRRTSMLADLVTATPKRDRSISCSEPWPVFWLSPITGCCSQRARPRGD